MDRLVKSADTQILVSKVREVGKRKTLDKVRLVNAGVVIANRNAQNILQGLENISSDGTVSPLEKRQLALLYEQIKSEYGSVIGEADKYKNLLDWTDEQTNTLNNYKSAFNELSAVYEIILENMDTSSTISQSILSQLATTYYENLRLIDAVLQLFRYGIDRIEVRYKVTEKQEQPKADEITEQSIPTMNAKDKYLWKKQTVYYTNGKTDVMIELASIYGDTGEKGDDGESGTSFSIMDRGFYTDTLANIKALEGQEVAWVANSFNGKVGDVLLVPCMISDLDNSIGYLPFTVSAIGDGYTLVGTNGYLIYGQEGEKGEDGFSYTVTIQSSNGNTFRMNEAVDTVLSVQVLRNGEDITSSMADYRFSWKRNTGNATADEAWNSLDKAISHKSVSITKDDCIGRTVFDCEVNLDNLA